MSSINGTEEEAWVLSPSIIISPTLFIVKVGFGGLFPPGRRSWVRGSVSGTTMEMFGIEQVAIEMVGRLAKDP